MNALYMRGEFSCGIIQIPDPVLLTSLKMGHEHAHEMLRDANTALSMKTQIAQKGLLKAKLYLGNA